jgi:hypothetical protein
MATTSGRLPYPVGTDKVVNGDDAIAALAQKIDDGAYYGGTIRALNNAVSGVLTQNTWQTVPLGAYSDVSLPTNAGIALPGNSTFLINRAGLYHFAAVVTLSAGSFAARIIEVNATRVIAAAYATAPLQYVSLSGTLNAGAGWQFRLQVYPLAAGVTIPVDSNANPVTMVATHLVQVR